MNAIEILEQGAATLAAQGARDASYVLTHAANYLRDPEWDVLHPGHRHGSSVKNVGMLTGDEERAARKLARRIAMEHSIVRRVVRDALKADYALSVDVGDGEPAVKGALQAGPVLGVLFDVDDAYLHLRRIVRAADGAAHVEHGWVRFVFGNEGWEVIADYTTNVEPLLAGANALAERMEARENR